MLYYLVQMEIKWGKFPQFVQYMENYVKPAFARNNIRMIGAYMKIVGRMSTVVHILEVDGWNGAGSLFEALGKDPKAKEMAAAAAEVIEGETLELMTKNPYAL